MDRKFWYIWNNFYSYKCVVWCTMLLFIKYAGMNVCLMIKLNNIQFVNRKYYEK